MREDPAPDADTLVHCRVTFRPEFQPPWTGPEQISTPALDRLDRRDRTVLVEQIASGKALPDEVVALVHSGAVPAQRPAAPAPGKSEAAEELYREALRIAQEQEAKLWELRAAVSLARLRRDRDRRAEARDLLATVYGWFTEGFDTPDLKDAKTLLDDLA